MLSGAKIIRQTARALGKVDPNCSILFVCDIQERFRSVIHQMPTVIETTRHMVGVCRELGVPCLATEQNPRVLLPSVPELQLGAVNSHPAVPIFAKQKFSMWTDEVQAHMAQLNTGLQLQRDTVILCGIEAHVCVLQTCLDLMQNGYSVHVVVDGVSSQRPLDRAVALRRMQQVGAFLTTAESVTFQMMETADNPSFRKVSALVKEHAKSPDQAFANMASL